MQQTTLQMKPTTEATLFLAVELSEKSWGLLFCDGGRRRAVSVEVGNVERLLEHVVIARAKFGLPQDCPVRSCHEAGRDGFWLHRALEAAGIHNFVIDSTSLEVDRRARRVKTDRLDLEQMMRQLIRFCGGEKKALRPIFVPTVEQEDARRPGRELERLTSERTGHTNRIKALLVLHGVRDVDVRKPEDLRTWEGNALPPLLRAELQREVERVELVDEQLAAVKKARTESLKKPSAAVAKVAMLMRLKGVGQLSAWLFVQEFFGWRTFRNRRQVGSAAGLVGAPYNSGDSEHEQGITKAGNRRVRTMAVQIAWLWLRFQPKSALSLWFNEKFAKARRSKRVGIVAVARRLLIDLWRYVEHGVIPTGAILEAE